MWGMVGQVVEPIDSAENHGPGAIASEVQVRPRHITDTVPVV